MNAFENFLAQLFLLIIPDPLVWAFLLVIIFALALVFSRVPGTIAVSYSLILASVLASYLGGVFNIFYMLLLAAGGVSIVLALYKLGGAR